MKTAAFTILSLAAVASGFTPAQQFGQRSTALYAEVMTGSVKWFDTAKGFGFIVPDDGSNDVFVHQTAIKAEGFRSLAEGESVEFKISTDANGKSKAVDVTGPDGSDVQGAPYNANKGYDEW
ncbi:hypothetical protein ACHAWO_003992 [Cyclotella atomus]|uniref:CSD domain-containing protein n=1 Tax=Cyclotella atomus TaxID=382360 RepID=A0ABD3NEM2_9STRA